MRRKRPSDPKQALVELGVKLVVLLADPKNVGKLCEWVGNPMPNVAFKTLGGILLWETVAEKDGWKVQRNKLTDHFRILDTSNVRRAWGSRKAVEAALQRLA